jgi:hypothetical protein
MPHALASLTGLEVLLLPEHPRRGLGCLVILDHRSQFYVNQVTPIVDVFGERGHVVGFQQMPAQGGTRCMLAGHLLHSLGRRAASSQKLLKCRLYRPGRVFHVSMNFIEFSPVWTVWCFEKIRNIVRRRGIQARFWLEWGKFEGSHSRLLARPPHSILTRPAQLIAGRPPICHRLAPFSLLLLRVPEESYLGGSSFNYRCLA